MPKCWLGGAAYIILAVSESIYLKLMTIFIWPGFLVG